MNCNCITELDKKLKEENLKLSSKHFALTYPDFKLAIYLNLEYIDKTKAPKGKKSSPPKMYMSHCPFCGVLIKETKEFTCPECGDLTKELINGACRKCCELTK